MGKKYVVLLLTLVVLVLLSGAYVIGGTQAYSRYQQHNLANAEHCGGQNPVHICVQSPPALFSAFYPSYVSSQHPLFKVNYSSNSTMTLLISVSIAGLSQEQVRTVNASSSLQVSNFVPPLRDSILRGLTADTNTSLHVKVSDTEGQTYYANDIPLALHSRWMMQWLTSNRLKIAAWVTPNDPAISELVRKATARLPAQEGPSAMIGYEGTPEEVIAQVNAIYDTLRLDYGIKYEQATVPYTSSSGENNSANVTQFVKLPAEVLQQARGMCVDMTVLLAAAVEKIGLQAQIVIIPGHAFLGVAVTENGEQVQFWDVVDMNNNVAADSANVAANNMYQKHQQERTIVDVIPISEARAARVGPMV